MKNFLVICFAACLSQAAFSQETTTSPAPEAPKKACCAAGASKDGKSCCAKGAEKTAACDDHTKTEANTTTNANQTTTMVKKTAVAVNANPSESFKVWGNCGMCKKTIEKAAKGVAGVRSADWNVETHQFTVVFDPAKANVKQVHQAIAKAGYDTDMLRGDDTAYKNLHGCCQYDRKEQ